MRSNLEYWKRLHENGYFENHRYYAGYKGQLEDKLGDDLYWIEKFVPLSVDDIVVVIGCGYGRECVKIGRRVRMVYGIDVSDLVLSAAMEYVHGKGVHNFMPVRAETYDSDIPHGIDLVYSIVTMQHVTRDIARDYLARLRDKLTENGSMVIQFLEVEHGEHDAQMKVYEPCVSWSMPEIAAAAVDMRMLGYERLEGKNWTHHWVHLGR